MNLRYSDSANVRISYGIVDFHQAAAMTLLCFACSEIQQLHFFVYYKVLLATASEY
jgi:hypothetical protein